jgi:hypothetical protein
MRAVVAICVAFLTACTRVEIHSNDAVEVRRSFGLTQLEITAPTSPVFVETSGVGVVNGQRRMTLGWMHEQLAIFPDPERCAALIYVKRPEDLEAVTRILNAANSNLNNICIGWGQ